MGQRVRVRSTPSTWQQTAAALARAWPAVVGSPIADATLAILVAHAAMEIGWDGKGSHNFNLGNVMLGNSPGNWTEWASGGQNFKRKWRAFTSLDNGARGWLGFLQRNYPEAFAAAARGDAAAYPVELQKRGYAEEGPAYVKLFRGVHAVAAKRIGGGDAARAAAGGAGFDAPPAIVDEPPPGDRPAAPPAAVASSSSSSSSSLLPLGLGVLALLSQVGDEASAAPLIESSGATGDGGTFGEALALGLTTAAVFGGFALLRGVRGFPL
jgi:hypothetical protein